MVEERRQKEIVYKEKELEPGLPGVRANGHQNARYGCEDRILTYNGRGPAFFRQDFRRLQNKGNGPTTRLALRRRLQKRNDWGEDKNYAREMNRARECMVAGCSRWHRGAERRREENLRRLFDEGLLKDGGMQCVQGVCRLTLYNKGLSRWLPWF
ncbi:hypothetical protein C8R44DRAFT_847695 [Mycena epipterygia]|nr:hypothetical protein C8R44DRAFT_847695 [Mycena epipterygia]